MITPMNLGLFL